VIDSALNFAGKSHDASLLLLFNGHESKLQFKKIIN